MTSTSSNEPPLDANEAQQLTAIVAELAGAELPLSSGLRAVADEAESRRLAGLLRDLADHIEQGQSLTEAMNGLGNRVPTFVRELIAAAARTGRLATVLNEFVEHQQRAQELVRGTRGALAYPLVILVVSLLVATFLPILLVPRVASMYRDFDLKLPERTEAIFWIGEVGAYYLLAAAAILGLSIIILRCFGGEVLWRSSLAGIPLLGRIWYWSSLAQMCRLVGLLIESGMPLPQAFDVAESGIDSLALRRTTRRLAQQVKGGRALSDLLQTTPYWPQSMVPFVKWGERNKTLPEAFRAVAEIFAARAADRAKWFQSILPPFLFIFVAFVALGTITSLMAPLLDLITRLS